MNKITVQQSMKDGAPMWDVEGEHFPGLAPSYARLETVLGLLEARARDWERFYVVTVIEPDVPVRVLTFDGDKMQKLLPMEWEKAAWHQLAFRIPIQQMVSLTTKSTFPNASKSHVGHNGRTFSLLAIH